MYAVVETGGKQYKVNIGQVIEVEKLAAKEGDTVELDRVLMVSENGEVRVGTPVLEGVKVSATVLKHFQDRKKIIFKYMAKQRYRRKRGHRQVLTRLQIEKIVL